MAITEMSKLLIKEKGAGGDERPITGMLKLHFRPHESADTEQNRLENAQWEATVDRLAQFDNPSDIFNYLNPILIPANPRPIPP